MTLALLWDDFGVTLGCRYRQAAAVSPLLTVAAAALPPPPSPPLPGTAAPTPDSTQTDGDYHRPPRFSTMEGANSWTILVDSACETCAKTSILNAANCHLMMKWRGYIIVSKLWRPTIVFRGSWARTRRRHLCGMRELLTTRTRRENRLSSSSCWFQLILVPVHTGSSSYWFQSYLFQFILVLVYTDSNSY